MYRLCKLFLSDITAGENLLRNAFIPIARENGTADHGVLFAANGTCKTTMLSFILSVFSPDKRRFVQHLQSTGDKTLEQYLIPGRPAVVAIDMASIDQPTLFDAASHLVLGQFLYRPRGTTDKVERLFFIAQRPDFFDQLRTTWDSLLAEEQPWRAVRDFATPLIQQTSQQNEWSSVLQDLGLDPWLLDRQVDFARSEGGIKDAFKFRSEAEFLNFFLGCVTDMEAAATLREGIGRSLHKMEDRPRKLSQLNAAQELKEKLRDFDTKASQWRKAQEKSEASKNLLGEASYLLDKAYRAATEKIEFLAPNLDTSKKQRHEAYIQKEIARASLTAVKLIQAQQTDNRAKEDLKRAEQEMQACQKEENSLKAADIMASIRYNHIQEEIKREALQQADTELSPLLKRIDILALQYHTRLDADRQQLLEQIQEEEAQIAALQAEMTAMEENRTTLGVEQRKLEEERVDKVTRIRTAELLRKTLPLHPGERSEKAMERLTQALAEAEDRSKTITQRQQQLGEEIHTSNNHWRHLQKDHSEAAVQLQQALQEQENEVQQRQQLLTSSHLRRIAGQTLFDPTSADLISRLDDALTRCREKINGLEERRLDLNRELTRLNATTTLTADIQTQQLIAYYHEQGISRAELKAFPEYLASLYTEPQEIARFIESDPGRFTGIMAVSETVIKAIQKLPIPEWLHRPVVISTPVTPEDLHPIAETILCPSNPSVYSEHYLQETRSHLLDQVQILEQEITEQRKTLREMEVTSLKIHSYREKFSDTATCTALSDKVQRQEQKLTSLATEISEVENLLETLTQRRTELEQIDRTCSTDRERLKEWQKQVQEWREQYGPLQEWKNETEKIDTALRTLSNRLDSTEKAVQKAQEKIFTVKGDIREQQSRIRGLDEQARSVQRPEGILLQDEDRQQALSMDHATLKSLLDEARDRQRHRADELGLATLQRELNEIQTLIGNEQTRLKVHCREQNVDMSQAEQWAPRSNVEREERKVLVNKDLQTKISTMGGLQSSIRFHQRDIESLNRELSEFSSKGIKPAALEESVHEEDLEGLIAHFQRESEKQNDILDQLTQHCRELESNLKAHETWQQEARVGLAETQAFPPLWDQHSPREEWPELIATAHVETNISTIRALKKQSNLHMTAFEAERLAMESSRKSMGRAFEQLRADLASERYRTHLPAVVDELLHHDTESLGTQAEECIIRCEELAQNIESDLSISQQLMDNLVDMLLSRAKEYHQKLQTAAQQILPQDVFIYGGQNILKAGTRLDFTRHGEDFRNSVENWLYELIQQNRLPEVNPRVGNCLGSELLYQLLGACTGKKTFGIRLLKCDDTGKNYEQVGKDLGSGGEALTTAVLLYTLLIYMRRKRHSQPDQNIPAFLILDNPLGVCNRSDFLDAQLKVARSMGIQCVYLTGINDQESLGLFELRVAIRKGKKKVEIGNETYDLLEIAELHVEKTHGPTLA